MKLEGAVAVVTGAGSGLGEALVVRLADEGATPVVLDLRPDRVERVVDDLVAAGHEATGWTCDVSDRDAVKQTFAEIGERLGRVDLLVNNAGRSALVPFLDMTDEEVDWVTGPNLMGPVHCIRAAAPLMPPGSRIVNVTSLSGRIPTPGEAYYSGCKAAVVVLSEALVAELRGRGIGVTVVMPGEMSTALFDEHPSWDLRPEWQHRMEVPPERVAAAVVRGIRRNRFEVVYPRHMRATLLFQRVNRTLFRWGVGRYYRTVEGRISRTGAQPAARGASPSSP
ncbi:MAG: SDR family oxidoreductase [Actinobacteria bacterium]|nr:SDR family oxidoreductase [Actinomycetota bacterium]